MTASATVTRSRHPSTRPAAPQRPGPKRPRRRWLFLACALLAFGLGTFALLHAHSRHRSTDLVTKPVHFEDLNAKIVQHGTLEPARTWDVVCRVKARTRGNSMASIIKWVVPESTRVRQGDVVVLLDDSGIREDLQAQRVAVLQAHSDWLMAEQNHAILKSQNESSLEAARAALQLAELDCQKYELGDARQTLDDIEGRRTLAQGDVEAWRDRVAWAKRMVRKGFLTPRQARDEQDHLAAAELALANVVEEKRVFLGFTDQRQHTDYRGKAALARGELGRLERQARAQEHQTRIDMLKKQAIARQQERRYCELQEQVECCTLRAPHDGMVFYCGSNQVRYGMGQQPVIAQGEVVREGQCLLQIPDLSRMIVDTRLHEALLPRVHPEESTPDAMSDLLFGPEQLLASRSIARDEFAEDEQVRSARLISAGDPVRIQLPARPQTVLHGHVKSVALIPSFWEMRVYGVTLFGTQIAIDDPVPGLLPGMSADVTIMTEHSRHHVLAVPVDAIVSESKYDKTGKCLVLTDDGVEERALALGLADEKLVEVRTGLEEGEQIVVNPQTLLNESSGRVGVGQP
jgi:multidrug efflux pump subunit AcrA (membrane-fusion protein)